jgi:MFS family permease
MGILADRWNRKRLLALGLIVNALGFIGLAAAPNYPMAIVCVALAGFGGSFYHPSATAMIARLFPEGRGRALGLNGMGASVGFFLGPLYCGWRAVSSGNWRVPVAELGIAGLVAAALFLLLAREEPAATGQSDSLARPAAAPVFPSAALWALFLGMSVCFSLRDFGGSGLATSASLFFQSAHGFSPKLAGLALSGMFIMSLISNPLFGHLSDRGRLRWAFGVLSVAAVLVAIFPRVPVGWSIPVLLAYGFFFMASYPISEAALMDSVPDAVRGRVFGLFITIGGFLGNSAHWIVGKWVEYLGSDAANVRSYYSLYLVLSLMIVCSLLALPFMKALRHKEHLDSSKHSCPAS